MSYSIPLQFKATNKVDDDGVKVYSAVASTDALDRDNEVLLPKGAITENFMKNPVMLFIHNYRQMPVGQVTNLAIEDSKIVFDFKFADSDLGRELESAYKSNLMNAFSVGFYPKSGVRIDDNTPDEIEVEVADGTKQVVKLTKYTERPHAIISKWELLEISPVPVPSNPEALLIRAVDGVVRKMHGDGDKTVKGAFYEERMNLQLDTLKGQIQSFMKELNEEKVGGAVPMHETEMDYESEFDPNKAKAALAKWASEDGSGNKGTIDWVKYSKGFSYVNLEKTGNFSAYKFPHHTVNKDGELITVWKGVTRAMADLLKSKSDFDDELEDDYMATYQHLAGHYEQASKELDVKKVCPSHEVDCNDEELLKAIAEDRFDELVEERFKQADALNHPKDDDPKTDDSDDEIVVLDFSSIEKQIAEIEETLGLRMTMISDGIDEVMSAVEKVLETLSKKDVKEESEESEPKVDDEEDQLKVAQKTLDQIRKSLLETASED